MKGIYKVFLFCETMCECAPRLIHKTCFFFGRLLCTFVFIFVARKTDDRQRNDEEMICNFSNFSNLKIFDFLQIITFYVRKLLLKNHTFFIFSVFFPTFFSQTQFTFTLNSLVGKSTYQRRYQTTKKSKWN